MTPAAAMTAYLRTQPGLARLVKLALTRVNGK